MNGAIWIAPKPVLDPDSVTLTIEDYEHLNIIGRNCIPTRIVGTGDGTVSIINPPSYVCCATG